MCAPKHVKILNACALVSHINDTELVFSTKWRIGERGEGKTTLKPLHYKGTPIHRIVKGFIIQGGDFENGLC